MLRLKQACQPDASSAPIKIPRSLRPLRFNTWNAMTLYTETAGNGPELVMLHGWGLHGGVFDGFVAEFARDFRVTRVDLPGHGRSRDVRAPAGVTAWAQAVLEVAPPAARWLGWSLGGMVALAAALGAPDRVRSLLLVSSTPKFVAAADWPHAQQPEALARFAAGLRTDYRTTVQHFLTLQVQGDDHARAALRDLRHTVFAHGEPHPDGLAAGLDILRATDLRARLPALVQPARVIMGQYDRLTPPAAGEYLARKLRQADYHCIGRAAHAPFISHREEFLECVHDWAAKQHD